MKCKKCKQDMVGLKGDTTCLSCFRKAPECVHCHKVMKHSYGSESGKFPFCENPECPNLGLLQVGVEISLLNIK